MKPRYYLLAIAGLCVGLICGDKIGTHRQHDKDSRIIRMLTKKVERYENPNVFSYAERVARITRTDIYQVLSGKVRK